MKKNIITIAVTFLAMFATDFLIHGVLLKGTYHDTATLWRPEAEMPGYMPYMLLGQFITAALFALIFTHGYKGKGIAEGIRYGILIGLLKAGDQLVMYAVSPYPLSLTASWMITGITQCAIVGAITAAVYGKVQ